MRTNNRAKEKKTSPIRGTGFFLNSRSINLFITICDYDQVKKKRYATEFSTRSALMASRVVIVMCFWYHSTNQNNDVVSSGIAQGEGLGGGGVALPRHFSAVQNKNKESSNKIEEEISLVRNGVAI